MTNQVKTIGQVLQNKNVLQQSQTELVSSSQKMEMIKAYGTPKDFLELFNPDYQLKIYADTENCLFGNYPKLSQLKSYGKNMSVAWILPQLTDLSEYCGCRDKLEGKPLETCAHIIAQRFGYLKISELMLFFFRMKAGDYGRFYGTIDPLIITTSLNRFIIDRNILIDKRNQKLQELRDAEDRKNAITYEQWLEIKRKQQPPSDETNQ